MVLFLDFDGVLHPEFLKDENELLSRLPLIESVLREYPPVEIVISSAWRLKYSDPNAALSALRQHFAPDIATRVVDVTPYHRKLNDSDAPDGLYAYSRHWECEAWVRTHRPPGTRWMAMDDRAYLFKPFTKNLMAFDDWIAFTKAHQDPLRAYLTALTRDKPWPSM